MFYPCRFAVGIRLALGLNMCLRLLPVFFSNFVDQYATCIDWGKVMQWSGCGSCSKAFSLGGHDERVESAVVIPKFVAFFRQLL